LAVSLPKGPMDLVFWAAVVGDSLSPRESTHADESIYSLSSNESSAPVLMGRYDGSTTGEAQACVFRSCTDWQPIGARRESPCPCFASHGGVFQGEPTRTHQGSTQYAPDPELCPRRAPAGKEDGEGVGGVGQGGPPLEERGRQCESGRQGGGGRQTWPSWAAYRRRCL
jgi:hypothetical protein